MQDFVPENSVIDYTKFSSALELMNEVVRCGAGVAQVVLVGPKLVVPGQLAARSVCRPPGRRMPPRACSL